MFGKQKLTKFLLSNSESKLIKTNSSPNTKNIADRLPENSQNSFLDL